MSGLEDLVGKMVADEMGKMKGEDANFDPRGGQGPNIDQITASIMKSLAEPESKGQGLEQLIEANSDLKYIVTSLLKNPLIIPYVAAWLDGKLEKMTEDLKDLFAETFPTEKPLTGEEPAATAESS